jgi:ribosomal protein S18 acetylase RimI-like enzyme
MEAKIDLEYSNPLLHGQRRNARVEEDIFRNRPEIFLLVSSFNTSAQGFHIRLGYEKIGEITNATVRGIRSS